MKSFKHNIIPILISLGVIALIGYVFIQSSSKESKETLGTQEELIVRMPAVAGAFYPADRDTLSKQIEKFYENVDLETDGAIKILIVPHAGYEYSGQVAGFGYKQIFGKDIHTVVIIGPSHQYQFDGISVFAEGYWETPLGQVRVDEQMAEDIINHHRKIYERDEVHESEHSIEVQIPFFQKALGGFKIVPIIMGGKNENLTDILAKALASTIDEYTLIVISSDFSHYPNYLEANKVDRKTVDAILTGDVKQFEDTIADLMNQNISNLSTCACGQGAISVGMKLAKKLGINDIRFLEYANSGDITSDKSRVVGYASIGFFTKRIGHELTREEQEELLEISRETLESYIRDDSIPDIKIKHEFLDTKLGAFVTLKKNGQLRGCIGEFEPSVSLAGVVQQVTVNSATKDYRFQPVSESELEDITIEISVMSPRFKIDDPEEEIEIGKHGVYIQKGARGGVFLPQVATENNWDLDTFMGQLCSQKAGLSWECWKSDDIEIYVFTAQVFEE